MSRKSFSSALLLTGLPWPGMMIVLSVVAARLASRRGDHAVDAAAGRIVDEGIDAIPKSVGDVNNVGLRERDRYVAVGVRGRVMFQANRRSVEFQSVLGREHFARNAALRQRKEIIVPILDPLYLREIFARVLLRDDLCAGCLKPFIAVRRDRNASAC